MRAVLLIISLLSIMVACRPAKKVQRIQTAISKVDTSQPVVLITDSANGTNEAGDIFARINQQKIDYNFFSARVRVQYEGKEGGDEATAFVRMQKDSAIWLSLRGALGIEGFRVLITKDSVKVMNLLKKTVQLRSISFLQEVTQLPFDFYTLKNLIIGNPVFIDSNIVSYKMDGNNQLNVLMIGEQFKHLLTLDNADYKILNSKLDDVDVIRNRTCIISFGGYDQSNGVPFSTKRNISVSEHSRLDINLDFKQYAFDQPVTFPFSVPRNYSVQ